MGPEVKEVHAPTLLDLMLDSRRQIVSIEAMVRKLEEHMTGTKNTGEAKEQEVSGMLELAAIDRDRLTECAARLNAVMEMLGC